MSFKPTLFAAAAALALTLPGAVSAMDGIMITDPYARSSSPMARSGAAFMEITNHAGEADRLVAASSPISERVELHTHMEDSEGIMRMIEVEDGFEVPSGETIFLKRGGMHVMFLGLNEEMVQGDMVDLTLVFENAGEIEIEVPVDLERMDGHGHGHGGHGHGHNHGSDS